MRILIVEDHPLYAAAARQEVERLCPGAETVLATTLREALTRVEAERAFDYALLDLQLPGTQGIEALQALRAAKPTLRLAILSGQDDPLLMRLAFEEGAVGFIPKAMKTEAFVEALRLLLQGGFYFPPEAFAESTQTPATQGRLSPRELDVMSHLATGCGNKEIARAMGLSESTVKHHVAAILRKLDVGTRAEAILLATRLGWIRRR